LKIPIVIDTNVLISDGMPDTGKTGLGQRWTGLLPAGGRKVTSKDEQGTRGEGPAFNEIS